MLVNNYFIQTLVLCFSSDSDTCKNGDIDNFLQNGPKYTMKTPARMVIAKDVHWSTSVSDEGDACNDPIEIELPPIKEIISIQLNQTIKYVPSECIPSWHGGGSTDFPPQPTFPQEDCDGFPCYPDPHHKFPPSLPPSTESKLPSSNDNEKDPKLTSKTSTESNLQEGNEWYPDEPPIVIIPPSPITSTESKTNVEQEIASTEPSFSALTSSDSHFVTVPGIKPIFPNSNFTTGSAYITNYPVYPEPTDPNYEPDITSDGSGEWLSATTTQDSETKWPIVKINTTYKIERIQIHQYPPPNGPPDETDLPHDSPNNNTGKLGSSNDPNPKKWEEEHPDGIFVIIIVSELHSTEWIERAKNELQKSEPPKYIMVIDWTEYISTYYPKTAEYAKPIGDKLGEVIFGYGIDIGKVHIIAYYTGCHIAAFAARYLEWQYSVKVWKITALDPARDLWYHPLIDEEYRLSRLSANQVQVIHTNTEYYGYPDPLGHVDFYPSKGEQQPGCEASEHADMCSHERSVTLFLESITILAVGTEVKYISEGVFELINDPRNAIFGYHLEETSEGVYILDTNPTPKHLIPEGTYVPPIIWSPPHVDGDGEISDLPIFMYPPELNSREEYKLTEDSTVATEWAEKNPQGKMFVIVYGQGSSKTYWPEQLIREIRKEDDTICIIVVDWSKYVRPSYDETVMNALLVAKYVADVFIRWNLPFDRLYILGHSTSGHVAGLIGAHIRSQSNYIIQVIIALDPAKQIWYHPETPPKLKLHHDNAKYVIVIHTNTISYGYPDPLGHIDIYVEGGEIQPDCWEPFVESCSHYRAVELFTESVSTYAYAKKATWDNGYLILPHEDDDHVDVIIFGYHIDYVSSSSGVYYIGTNNKKPFLKKAPYVPPHLWGEEDYPKNDWPPIDPGLSHSYQIETLEITMYDIDVNRKIGTDIRGDSDRVTKWFNDNPHGQLIIILVGEDYFIDTTWPEAIIQELPHNYEPKCVLVVNWSKYVFKSYRFTASYSILVAEYLSELLIRWKLPFDRINIISYSTSAHIAGMIGKHIESTSHVTIQSIVGLDPAGPMWNHPETPNQLVLYKTDASFVMVIHTNTINYGFATPIGHIDYYINGGETQPGCPDPTVDECSHFRAIDLYLESFVDIAFAIEAKWTSTGIVLPTDDKHARYIVFGYYLEYNSSIEGVYAIDTNADPQFIIPGISNIPDPDEKNDNWPSVDDDVYITVKITELYIVAYPYGNVDGEQTGTGVNPGSIGSFLQDHPDGRFVLILKDGDDIESKWVYDVKDKLQLVSPPVYVLIVDWSKYKYESYTTTSNFAKPVGFRIAEIIHWLNIPTDRLEIIGFSIDAHIAGFIGKYLFAKYSKILNRITGLDPARRMWYHEGRIDKNRLCECDATFVDIIHTNTENFGIPVRMGHVDFFVNGGWYQPGCSRDYEDQCSHRRATELYVESFDTTSSGVEVGYKTGYELSFLNTTTFATLGWYAEETARGAYYIRTNGTSPYLISNLPQLRPQNPITTTPNPMFTWSVGNVEIIVTTHVPGFYFK